MNPKMQLYIRRHTLASKFDQDFLAFFDGGYNLELEASLKKMRAIESPESSSRLLKALGSISSRCPESPPLLTAHWSISEPQQLCLALGLGKWKTSDFWEQTDELYTYPPPSWMIFNPIHHNQTQILNFTYYVNIV